MTPYRKGDINLRPEESRLETPHFNGHYHRDRL